MCVRCRRCKSGEEEERECKHYRQEAAAKGKGPAICTRCRLGTLVDKAGALQRHDPFPCMGLVGVMHSILEYLAHDLPVRAQLSRSPHLQVDCCGAGIVVTANQARQAVPTSAAPAANGKPVRPAQEPTREAPMPRRAVALPKPLASDLLQPPPTHTVPACGKSAACLLNHIGLPP